MKALSSERKRHDFQAEIEYQKNFVNYNAAQAVKAEARVKELEAKHLEWARKLEVINKGIFHYHSETLGNSICDNCKLCELVEEMKK